MVTNNQDTDAPAESDWDPETDSLEDMHRLITAVAEEWYRTPCRCCGILLSDLSFLDDGPVTLPSRAEAVMSVLAFLEGAIWNAQIVRRAIPTRQEVVAARAAMVRISRLLAGDHDDIAKANEPDDKSPDDWTEEATRERWLGRWIPPHFFLSDYPEMEAPQEATTATARKFIDAADTLLAQIDTYIQILMFDPPPDGGRPRASFAERYAYRYLTAVGLSPAEVEDAIGPAVLRLRVVEQKVGLKKVSKSANPGSLRSTIRRFAERK
jgi:hypothetical protein